MEKIEQSRNVLIIGGGPAGMSCALWLKNYGLNPIIVEKRSILGGLQARSPASNTWLLGWQAVLGKDVAATFAKHIAYERIQVFLESTVEEISRISENRWHVCIQRGNVDARIEVSSIVFANGTDFVDSSWRKAVPGSEECSDLIYSGPPAYMKSDSWFGSHPVVIGGGDNAIECAYTLSCRGSHPIVLVRSESLRASDETMKRKFFDKVDKKLIDLRVNTSVNKMTRNNETVKLFNSDQSEIETTAVLLMIGYETNTNFKFDLPLLIDDNKYILINKRCETNIPSVYAIGDIANPENPCVATAVAMGTIAARAINNMLNENWPITS